MTLEDFKCIQTDPGWLYDLMIQEQVKNQCRCYSKAPALLGAGVSLKVVPVIHELAYCET